MNSPSSSTSERPASHAQAENSAVASILRYWKRNGFAASISLNMKFVGRPEACSVLVRTKASVGHVMGSGWDDADPVSAIQKAHVEVLQYMERNGIVPAEVKPAAPKPPIADDDEPA